MGGSGVLAGSRGVFLFIVYGTYVYDIRFFYKMAIFAV